MRIGRRAILLAGTGWAAGCGRVVRKPLSPLTITPIRASVDRIFRVTVCLRPFRAAGPRVETETIGTQTIVHNYGHGGSGWSLSWGSSARAVEMALRTGEKKIGVIGCGALGLTSALLAQRAGLAVTIYARERPPEVASSWATGSWTPDSRIALASKAPADFGATWERMARTSWRHYESLLGLPGDPVEWLDRYQLSDSQQQAVPAHKEGQLDFARYMDRIPDLMPRSQLMAEGTHPWPAKYVRRGAGLTFNVASLSHLLVSDFLTEGGKIVRREFATPSELGELPEKTLIHATGYGARALFRDETIVPVRGQIAWLIPQAEARYAVMYKDLYLLSRRDGIVVQSIGNGEMEGYGQTDLRPDRAAAERWVQTAGELFAKMRA